MNFSNSEIRGPLSPGKHIMFVAGETSGDTHASHLVKELQELDERITFSGLGGPNMRAAGVQIDEDLTRFAVVGFVEILKHYSDFQRCFKGFLKNVKERKPDAVVLVDYPGFNLRLAAQLRRMRAFKGKIIYYISPQVWAWKENRVAQISRDVDRMLVLFEFEKEFYAKRGVNVEFVGHPLIDQVRCNTSREETLTAAGLATDRLTIGILAGSRPREIESLLPVMLQAAKILHRQDGRLQFLVLKPKELAITLYKDVLAQKELPVKILEGDFYNGINACDLCMVASGTATLETAILGKPMVVVYKTSFVTWALARLLIKIPDIGLVNIVAGHRIVPECIQFQATGRRIAKEIRDIYQHPEHMQTIIGALQKIKSLLGSTGASRRAAGIIYHSLE